MEKCDKGSTLTRMGVSGWMFLLVPAYPGCPGQTAVKWLLLLVGEWGCCYERVCLCLSVRPTVREHVSKATVPSFTKFFCACYPWSWLGPPLAALWCLPCGAHIWLYVSCQYFVPWYALGGVSIRLRRPEMTMGQRVKWVNKSEWVTWPVDPWFRFFSDIVETNGTA